MNLNLIESFCTVTARVAELAYAVSGLEAGKEIICVKDNYSRPAILSFLVLLASGCGGGKFTSTPTPACVPSSKPEFSYVLTGYAVSMFTVNSCTGQFAADTPASISTGYALPQFDSEEMVVDPLGRFA